jgi:hypothetical protein
MRLEARGGIEPPNKGFADLSLTTWVPRPGDHGKASSAACPESGQGHTGRAPRNHAAQLAKASRYY